MFLNANATAPWLREISSNPLEVDPLQVHRPHLGSAYGR
jgi:hypothetical protein